MVEKFHLSPRLFLDSSFSGFLLVCPDITPEVLRVSMKRIAYFRGGRVDYADVIRVAGDFRKTQLTSNGR
jgi:hypothetical protein